MIPSPASSPFQFSNFGSPQQLQQQQQQQQQLQQQQQQMPGLIAGNVIHLLSNDRTPLSYQAKWTDIHDDSKSLLLAIEEKMLEYREESRRLDQCQRLYDSSALQKGFDLESVRISQELRGVGAAVFREQSSLEEMVQGAKHLMRNAEVAVRSFMMLRHHFSRLQVPALTAGPTPSPGPLALTFSPAPSANQQPAQQTGPVADFYSGIPSKPSSFLQQTVSRFEAQLAEYGQLIDELERLLQDNNNNNSGDNGSNNSELSLLQSLPSVMSNVHDFFIHVAAEVESLHQQIEVMRTTFIADRHRRGDDSNPFLEADRREVAKREAAAKRVHPTLHAPFMPLAIQTPGMGPNTPTMATYGAGSVQSIAFPGQSSGPVFGAQGTPNPFSSSSVQYTPTPTQFTPSTFASTPALGSSAPFSTFPMFGASTPSASTTLSVFGASTPAAPFGTVPSTGLFGGSPGTPFGGVNSGNIFGSTFGVSAPAAALSLSGMGMGAAGTGASAPAAAPSLFTTTGAGAGGTKAKPRGPRRK